MYSYFFSYVYVSYMIEYKKCDKNIWTMLTFKIIITVKDTLPLLLLKILLLGFKQNYLIVLATF